MQPEEERPQRLLSIGGHLHEHQPTAVGREGLVVELGHQPGVIVGLQASDQEEEDVVDEERRVGVDGDLAAQDRKEQRAIVGVMFIVANDTMMPRRWRDAKAESSRPRSPSRHTARAAAAAAKRRTMSPAGSIASMPPTDSVSTMSAGAARRIARL